MYQTLAEILVIARRIVLRGLVKVSGPTWYKVGCPPSLFDRLVARKENELSIDRFDREYQELIGYASLDDLAEIVDYNEDLAELLQTIAPPGSTMVERFREIEAFRLKLAAAVPFDDDDMERLFEYHRDLRDALERRMQKSGDMQVPAVPPPSEDLSAAPPVEVDERNGELDSVLAEIDRLAEGGEGTFEDYGTVVTVADTATFEVTEIERAMADDDDVEVLRVLREEVMVVAEGVLQNDLRNEYFVWEAICAAGWFSKKQTALQLEPVERFYTVVEEIRIKHREGAGLEATKAHLQVVEFSKLLLELREMFLIYGL